MLKPTIRARGISETISLKKSTEGTERGVGKGKSKIFQGVKIKPFQTLV